jgi:hypothetical protein
MPSKSKAKIFKPKKPLRALRPGEIIFVFFSRKGAKDAKKIKSFNFLTQQTFAGFAPWRDYIFFPSQRRQERQETQKLKFFTPKTFAGFAPWRD